MHRNLGDKDLNLPQYYNNRELSWLDFNYRVLQEAQDHRHRKARLQVVQVPLQKGLKRNGK